MAAVGKRERKRAREIQASIDRYMMREAQDAEELAELTREAPSAASDEDHAEQQRTRLWVVPQNVPGRDTSSKDVVRRADLSYYMAAKHIIPGRPLLSSNTPSNSPSKPRMQMGSGNSHPRGARECRHARVLLGLVIVCMGLLQVGGLESLQYLPRSFKDEMDV